MSLETLLEAAEFLESKKWRTPPKARGEESSQDFHHYAKTSSIDDNGDSSLDSSHGQGGFGDDIRDKRRYGGAGTREVHNKLEKNRRAHLKECFEVLKKQIPFMEDKKTSNLSILRGSLKYIQNLKRKEKEYEQELQRLAQEKSRLRDRIAALKMELAEMNIEVDLHQWMRSQEQETNSTSTATEGGSPILSEAEDDLDEDESPTLQRIAPKSVINSPSRPMPLFKNTTSSKTAALIGNPPVQMTPATTAPTPVAPKPPLVRPPVTQILHDTLTQRQALQKQQALAASQNRNMTQMATVKQSMTQIRPPFQFSGLAPSTTTVTPSGGQSAGQPGKLMTATVNIPMPNMSKALGHPLLVATNLSNNTVQSAGGTSSAILNHLNSVKNSLPNVMTTLASPTVTTVTSVPTIKPIFATSPAAAAQLMSGQLTFNPLIAAGTLPTKNTGQVLTTGGNVPAITLVSGGQTQVTAMPHIMSLAQMGLNNMTVMSPGVPVANLGSAPLNNVLSQQALLKQIPLLQSHLLPSGQVLGTPVVKPVVVVSMPNVTTTTTPTVQVTSSTT